jgi:RNA recognition motif-containing protein
MGPDGTVRLYVGGLPGEVSKEQLAQRFQPFGAVAAVQLVPEKPGTPAASRPSKPCRGFAYVQLVPKDEAALHRCLSMVCACMLHPARLLLLLLCTLS